MKKIYLLFSLISIASIANSQTLISGHFPSPGDVYEYFNTDTLGIVAGPAGTAQIWNFEDLNVDTVLKFENYISPIVTTPPVTGHTTATGDSLQGFTFFKNTTAKYEMLGFSDSANVNVVAYSNPMTMVTFPFSYNNSATDSFAFTTTFQGNSVNATGTITTTADGSGNLLLPQGAFNNVLRVKYNVVVNLLVLFFNVTQTQTIYEWYDGYYKFPLLHIENVETTDPFGGAPTIEKVIQIKSTGPAGLHAIDHQVAFNLAPNPAQDVVNVKINNAGAAPTKVVITNSIGQLVYQHNNVDAKLNNLNISTSNLEKGVYFVTVIQNDKTFTKKLVVQ